jgi:AraC-like DNA-binding protein
MQRIGVLVELPRLLREAGIDPAPVFTAAGVHPGLLSDIDGILPFDQFASLVVRSIEATGNESFDLRIGSSARLSHLGVLGSYMSCGPTLGSAINDIVTNHSRYVRGGGPYLFDLGDGDLLIGYRTHRPDVPGARHIARAAVAFGYAIFKEVSGVTPRFVHLSRHEPVELGDYLAAFGRTSARYNSEHFGLAYSRESLQAPSLKADPELRRQLGKMISARWEGLQPDIRERVMRTLVPSVFSGTSTLEATAALLNMTPDALSRELRECRTTFRDLLAAARTEMAAQLLVDTTMSISQISHVLGYSEISAFTRFFKAARNVSPTEWRRTGGGAPPPENQQTNGGAPA